MLFRSLDINMPEMDGYEVAERIRTIDPKVLIFFLTDRTEKNDRLKGFSLEAYNERRKNQSPCAPANGAAKGD